MTYYGLEELDRLIAAYVTQTEGVFVELGAHNGVEQNNSLYFENLGWRGVLIEPIPSLYEACVQNRPLAKVFNAACVPFGHSPTIEMISMGLMSTVTGTLGDRQDEWIARGTGNAPEPPPRIQVPARSLTDILVEAEIVQVDMLCLDVEGYEIRVLEGLDLERFAPHWIVSEDLYADDLKVYLEARGYELVCDLLERRYTRDRLYRQVT